MENQYGVAVKNKYELFLDDDQDPLEILRLQEEANLKKKDEKSKKDVKNEKTVKQAKGKQNKKPAPAVIDTKPKGTDQNANKREGVDRPPRNRPPRQEREGGERPQGNRPPREGGFRGEGGFREGGGVREGGFREGGFREGGFRGDRPPRREQGERGERPPPSGEFRERSGDRPESGRGRGGFGRGRGRGGRGRGGFDRFGKRDFDRHSGSDKTSSGVKPTDKREGGGAHNWGTVKDDLDREQLNESNVSEENQDWTAQPEEVENQDPNATENAEEEALPEEEPVREMTLDEYKAQQEKARAKAAFNIRRPNEGTDESQWKKTYMYKKKPVRGEDEEDDEEEESDDDLEIRRKNVVPIKITFNDTPRFGGRGGRRGRGGRGGGVGDRGERGERERGGGGGGRGRGERPERGGGGGGRGGGGFKSGFTSKEAALHIEDENDFPSLVKPASS